jgi:hypothetical protein
MSINGPTELNVPESGRSQKFGMLVPELAGRLELGFKLTRKVPGSNS